MLIKVSPRMVSEVLPSPSLASVMFVGEMLRPTSLQKAVLTVHAEVHPVSHTRSTVTDLDVSSSLDMHTGSDGVGLTHSSVVYCSFFCPAVEELDRL